MPDNTDENDNENEPNGYIPDEATLEAAEKERRTRRRAFGGGFFIALILAVGLAVWLSQEVPYYSISPGPTEAAGDLVVLPKGQEHVHKGSVYFTTVQKSNDRVTRAVYYWGKTFDDETEFEPAEEVEDSFGPPTITGVCVSEDDLQAQEWTDSQQRAVAVAMKRLGKHIEISESGAQVAGFLPKSPSRGKLRACETIVKVDGKDTPNRQSVIDQVRSHIVGETVSVTTRGVGDDTRTVKVKTTANKDGQPQLGIVLVPNSVKVDSDIDIKFRDADIGGPSAGLAFALDLLNSLSKSDITGGQRVAATGDIYTDGTIEEIGGIREKVISVSHSGIRLFLVPKANEKEAKRAAPDSMKIVGVRTLDDALAALKANGGDLSGLPGEELPTHS